MHVRVLDAWEVDEVAGATDGWGVFWGGVAVVGGVVGAGIAGASIPATGGIDAVPGAFGVAAGLTAAVAGYNKIKESL